jgi:soluble lytic murein transglycosylase
MMVDNHNNKNTNHLQCSILFSLFIVMMSFNLAAADIYVYVDKDGVRHFTNAPTSSNYRLYMKSKKSSNPPVTFSVSNSHLNGSDQFDGLIDKASRDFGISPRLLKSIIKVESNFNPAAVSKKGARGLMQIMPHNFDDLEIFDWADPYQNIMGGTRYLKQMLDKYDGKLHLALAAYNAGPAAVDKYNDIPPYKETKNYIRRVTQYFDTFGY